MKTPISNVIPYTEFQRRRFVREMEQDAFDPAGDYWSRDHHAQAFPEFDPANAPPPDSPRIGDRVSFVLESGARMEGWIAEIDYVCVPPIVTVHCADGRRLIGQQLLQKTQPGERGRA